MSTGPAAVLWDLDGTLVDTEPFWIEAEYEIATRHGGTWSTEHAMALVGSDLLASGEYIRAHLGIETSAAEIVADLLDVVVQRVSQQVPWRPGAVAQLAALRGDGVPCALVTMSYTRLVAPILSALPDATFEAIVTGDRVSNGKPHPEAYLTAATLLGVDPTECLAVEDSIPGAASAEAAGCAVLVVPHHVQVAPGPRRVFADSLVGADLAALWRTASSTPA